MPASPLLARNLLLSSLSLRSPLTLRLRPPPLHTPFPPSTIPSSTTPPSTTPLSITLLSPLLSLPSPATPSPTTTTLSSTPLSPTEFSAPPMLPRTDPLSTSSSVRLKLIPLSCTLPTVTLPTPVSMVLVSMVSTTLESTPPPPLSSLTLLSRPLTTPLPPPPSDTLTLPTSVSAPTLTVSRSPVNYHHRSILHQDSYLV